MRWLCFLLFGSGYLPEERLLQVKWNDMYYMDIYG